MKTRLTHSSYTRKLHQQKSSCRPAGQLLLEKCQRENAKCIWKVGARVSKCTKLTPVHTIQNCRWIMWKFLGIFCFPTCLPSKNSYLCILQVCISFVQWSKLEGRHYQTIFFNYTNSLDNADSFYAKFTNTTFQKIPIPHLTRTMKQKFLH